MSEAKLLAMHADPTLGTSESRVYILIAIASDS